MKFAESCVQLMALTKYSSFHWESHDVILTSGYPTVHVESHRHAAYLRSTATAENVLWRKYKVVLTTTSMLSYYDNLVNQQYLKSTLSKKIKLVKYTLSYSEMGISCYLECQCCTAHSSMCGNSMFFIPRFESTHNNRITGNCSANNVLVSYPIFPNNFGWIRWEVNLWNPEKMCCKSKWDVVALWISMKIIKDPFWARSFLDRF